MSYCRFRSDHRQSAVYVYLAEREYVTHVAARKKVLTPAQIASLPELPAFNDRAWPAQWLAREAALRALCDAEPWTPVVAPFGGQTYHDDTATECADRLEALRAAGVYVPQDAIDELREEAIFTEDPPRG